MIQHFFYVHLAGGIAMYALGYVFALIATKAERDHGKFHMGLERDLARSEADAEARRIVIQQQIDAAEGQSMAKYRDTMRTIDWMDRIDEDDASDIDEVNGLGIEDLEDDYQTVIVTDEGPVSFAPSVDRIKAEQEMCQASLGVLETPENDLNLYYAASQALSWVLNPNIAAPPSHTIRKGVCFYVRGIPSPHDFPIPPDGKACEELLASACGVGNTHAPDIRLIQISTDRIT